MTLQGRTPALSAALIAAAAIVLSAWAPAAAESAPRAAAPTVRLSAALSPERLRAGTTIAVGFEIVTAAGLPTSPLTQMQLRLPAGLEIGGLNELGLQTCFAGTLRRTGRCPPNSLIGFGGALAAVSFGSQLVFEHTRVRLFSGPLLHGDQTVLVYVHGEHPALASLVFGGSILSAHAPFGGQLEAKLPPVPALPEAPDVAVLRFHTTIGSRGILYRERVKGRLIRFQPKGIVLPGRCPRGGFPFAVRLGFQDGASASARTAVPCPRARRRP